LGEELGQEGAFFSQRSDSRKKEEADRQGLGTITKLDPLKPVHLLRDL
jgi:hypothetical protein